MDGSETLAKTGEKKHYPPIPIFTRVEHLLIKYMTLCSKQAFDGCC